MSILGLYLHPTVSDPLDPGYTVPTWSRQLDISRIARFSSDMFEWGNIELRAKFRRNLWKGLAMRQIRQSVLSDDEEVDLHLSARLLPSEYLKLVTERKCEASTDFVPAWRVELDPDVFDPFVNAGLPVRDPHPFPDINDMSESERERFVAQRKKDGKPSKLPAAPAGVSEYRHWIPAEILESCKEGHDIVQAHDKLVKLKQKEKAEEEKRKKERALARSSPDKKKKAASRSPRKAASRSPRKAPTRPDTPHSDDDPWSDLDEQWARIEQDRAQKARQEMLAQARKSKGKGKAKATLPDSPASTGGKISRLRGSTGGNSYASTSGGNATLDGMGFGRSTKAAQSLSPLAKFNIAPLPTPPATVNPFSSSTPQGRMHLPSSDDSDTPQGGHVAKANRTSASTTSPRKARRKPMATPIEISSGEDEEGNLEKFLAARRRKHEDAAARKAGRSSAAPGNKSAPARALGGDTEVIVLD